MEHELMTVEELAQALKVSHGWIYRHAAESSKTGFPVIKIGRYCRFYLDDVLAYFKTQNEGEG